MKALEIRVETLEAVRKSEEGTMKQWEQQVQNPKVGKSCLCSRKQKQSSVARRW